MRKFTVSSKIFFIIFTRILCLERFVVTFKDKKWCSVLISQNWKENGADSPIKVQSPNRVTLQPLDELKSFLANMQHKTWKWIGTIFSQTPWMAGAWWNIQSMVLATLAKRYIRLHCQKATFWLNHFLNLKLFGLKTKKWTATYLNKEAVTFFVWNIAFVPTKFFN